MRIGFVVGRGYPNPTETFVSRKVEYLLSQGHEVIIFEMSSLRRRGEAIKRKRPRIVVITPDDRGLLRNGLRALMEMARSARSLLRIPQVCRRTWNGRYRHSGRLERLLRFLIIAKYDLDILHVHFADNLSPLLGVREAVGIPVVVSLLGSDVSLAERFPGRNHLELLPNQADALLASSAYLVTEFRRRTQSRTDVRVLPPEVPYSSFEGHREYDGSSNRILTVARLHWKKSLIYALHAAHELKRRGWVFSYDIVGEGNERLSLEKAIEDLGLQGVVRLHGTIDPSETPDFFKQAAIFVLPSVREEFGVVLLEAQASGVPVVATRVGGIPEAVQEGETAILVPPRNPLALADAIEKLMRDPALRRQYGLAGRRHAKEFDTKKIGTGLLAIYSEVCAKQNSRDAASSKRIGLWR
jgi:glycosyltransferase involved in cell wall biosynthesis